MQLTFVDHLFICWVVFFGLWAMLSIIYFIGKGIAKLRGKRPYDGRFRTGGCL
jgi:hypothetical protein